MPRNIPPPTMADRHATRRREAVASFRYQGWPTGADSLQHQDGPELPGGMRTTFWLLYQGNERLAAVIVETMADRDQDTAYPVDGITAPIGTENNHGIARATNKAVRFARRDLAMAAVQDIAVRMAVAAEDQGLRVLRLQEDHNAALLVVVAQEHADHPEYGSTSCRIGMKGTLTVHEDGLPGMPPASFREMCTALEDMVERERRSVERAETA